MSLSELLKSLHVTNFIEASSAPPLSRSLEDVLKWGALSANIVSEEPIDVVLHEAYDDHDHLWNDYTLEKFIPFNPTDKYTIAHVKDNKTGETTRIMKGAPQVRPRA
jgi:H+-transporting ATPase